MITSKPMRQILPKPWTERWSGRSLSLAPGVIVVIAIALSLSACAKESWYESAKAAQTAECMKQPLSEYKDCNPQTDESYSSYSKKRELLEEEQGQKTGAQ